MWVKGYINQGTDDNMGMAGAQLSNLFSRNGWVQTTDDWIAVADSAFDVWFTHQLTPSNYRSITFVPRVLYTQITDAAAAEAAAAFSNGALDLSAVTISTPADHDAKLASIHDLFVATDSAKFRVASGLAKSKLSIESSKQHIDIVRPKAYASQPANIAAIKAELLADAAAELDVSAMSYSPLDAENPAVVLRYPNGVDVYVLRET